MLLYMLYDIGGVMKRGDKNEHTVIIYTTDGEAEYLPDNHYSRRGACGKYTNNEGDTVSKIVRTVQYSTVRVFSVFIAKYFVSLPPHSGSEAGARRSRSASEISVGKN